MKAIYRGELHHVIDDAGDGVILDYEDEPGWIKVEYGEDSLIVDPTDDQVDAARAGLPIPPDPDDTPVSDALIAHLVLPSYDVRSPRYRPYGGPAPKENA